MDTKHLLRLARYKERLKNMAPRGAISMTFGGDPRRALQILLEEDRGRGEHYAYLHRSPDDEVFYVGKGQGDRAYSRDRDEMWHHYLKTRCNDCYEVQIVKRFATEDEALECECEYGRSCPNGNQHSTCGSQVPTVYVNQADNICQSYLHDIRLVPGGKCFPVGKAQITSFAVNCN